jgi:hypothetical protein
MGNHWEVDGKCHVFRSFPANVEYIYITPCEKWMITEGREFSRNSKKWIDEVKGLARHNKHKDWTGICLRINKECVRYKRTWWYMMIQPAKVDWKNLIESTHHDKPMTFSKEIHWKFVDSMVFYIFYQFLPSKKLTSQVMEGCPKPLHSCFKRCLTRKTGISGSNMPSFKLRQMWRTGYL